MLPSSFRGAQKSPARGWLSKAGDDSIHNDPFDRLLIGQAFTEGFVLVTNDLATAKYVGSIRTSGSIT